MVGWKLTTQNSLALKFQIARRLMTKEKKKKGSQIQEEEEPGRLSKLPNFLERCQLSKS